MHWILPPDLVQLAHHQAESIPTTLSRLCLARKDAYAEQAPQQDHRRSADSGFEYQRGTEDQTTKS